MYSFQKINHPNKDYISGFATYKEWLCVSKKSRVVYMFIKKTHFKRLEKSIDDLNYALIKNHFIDLSEILGNRKELLIRNLLAGISKGIGIGIGFTILTAILVIILQKIVTLNIPVIGDYISDIVDIVENNRR